MIEISFQTTSTGVRAEIVFTNPSEIPEGYGSYDLILTYDPGLAVLTTPSSANFAGTAEVNTTTLGVVDLGGFSLQALSAAEPIGFLDFTSVSSSGFAIGISEVNITDPNTNPLYSQDTTITFASDGSVTNGGSSENPSSNVDSTAPTLVSSDPGSNETVSPTKAFISLNFDEAIVAGTGNIELRSGTNLLETFDIATSNRVSLSGATLTIDPTANLSGSTSYSLILPAGSIKDAAGNAIGSSLSIGFGTSAAGLDNTAPNLIFSSPGNTETGVATTSNLELKFSEAVQLGIGEIRLSTSSGTLVESFATGSNRITVNGDTVIIDPSSELSTNSNYRLTFTGNAVEDLAGNGYVSSNYSFQTANLSASALSVSSDQPSVNEGGTVTFTVSAPSLSAGTSIGYRLEGISLKDLDSSSLSGQISLNAGKTAQLSVRLKADSLVEGPETLTFTAEGLSASTTVIDTSAGSSLAQEIQAGSQGGTIMLSAGPDRVTGSSQRDIAFINGSSEDYSIQIQGDKAFIQQDSSLNIDTLLNVERVQFSDKSVALDIDGVPGQAYRIYKAAFGREPDLEGVGFWISRMEEQDWDLIEVSARFIDSNEFRASYGTNPSDAQYLTKLYENVLGRVPDLGGYNWWLNELETNPEKTRAKVLADFTESVENQDVTAELVAQGISYDPWVLG